MSATIARQSPSWYRFAGIVALFIVVGPLAGALGVNVLLSLLAAITEIARGNFGDIDRLLVGGIFIGVIVSLPIAYTFGLASALGVGLVVAIRDRRTQGVSLRLALGAAVVLWLAMSALATVVIPPEGIATWLAALLVAHLVAALSCAALSRAIFDRA